MELPVFSVVAKTSHNSAARIMLKSLLVTTLMLGGTEFPVRAQVAPEEAQSKIVQRDRTIKVRLKRSGLRDEWILVKISNDDAGQTVKAYHTTKVKKRLLSSLVSGVVNFGAGSFPVPDINFHGWVDHPTQRLTFIPEGCDATILDPQSICTIKGTDTLRLPMGMKIQAGQLTIEYLEESLVRSVTLRIPSE